MFLASMFEAQSEGNDTNAKHHQRTHRSMQMSTTTNESFQIAGIGIGGLLVLGGLALIILTGSNLLGIILVLVGLIGFGGFAKGKWY